MGRITSSSIFGQNKLVPVFHTDSFQKEEVTDWRKNVDAMSGMEGRKKLFNAGQ